MRAREALCGGLEGEIFGDVGVGLLEFGEEAGVGEIEGFGVFPVVVDDLADALDDVRVVDLDGELAAAVEAAGSEVDGAYDGAVVVGEEELGVELDVFELVNLDAEVWRMRRPLTPSTSLSILSLWGGRAMMWILTPRS